MRDRIAHLQLRQIYILYGVEDWLKKKKENGGRKNQESFHTYKIFL